MFGSALIVFREVLEASLIIGIVLAASRGIAQRGVWVGAGIAAGLLGAVVVAWFADAIASTLEGMGQEVFNAGVLLLAVVMLGWHQIWMSHHGRQLAMHIGKLGQAVKVGERSLLALAVVVGVALLREGSEAVLFLYGVSTSEEASFSSVASGAALGLGAGALCGAVMYFGLIKIPTKRLFTVTGWLILLLAAGMASQAAAFLVQAGLLPTLADPLWDTSAWLSRSSALGQLLHILVGYDDRPSGIQPVFYAITLLGIWFLSRKAATTAAPRPL